MKHGAIYSGKRWSIEYTIAFTQWVIGVMWDNYPGQGWHVIFAFGPLELVIDRRSR